MTTTHLPDRLAAVERRIAAAAADCGRSRSDITLIAVGKTFPAEIIDQAVKAGATDFGENRVQEGVAKRAAAPDARWHLIGPLQRNKARAALEVFDIVHTIDRLEIADRLQYLLTERWPDRRLEVLLEINLAEEPQKAGTFPQDAAGLLHHALSCDSLLVRGLMAIPPWKDDPEASRPWFQQLRTLRDQLEESTGHELPELSMGMSHDFEIAVAEGATMVRVGTAIFGPRSARK
ncbi:MAG: YggS family pyridoxal phosphate-dependent enzyme [Acidobacteriota bacterium]